MQKFFITADAIDGTTLRGLLENHQVGAIAIFEGWVRNHNQGHPVEALEYQVYESLAQKEGERILQEAMASFSLQAAIAVHRHGTLQLGDTAVWIGTSASHRRDVFLGTEFIINQLKIRLPIWKKEHYQDQPAAWVYCREHHHS